MTTNKSCATNQTVETSGVEALEHASICVKTFLEKIKESNGDPLKAYRAFLNSDAYGNLPDDVSKRVRDVVFDVADCLRDGEKKEKPKKKALEILFHPFPNPILLLITACVSYEFIDAFLKSSYPFCAVVPLCFFFYCLYAGSY